MIECIFIIAFVVYGIAATFWEGMIFHGIKVWMEERLPEWVVKPTVGCPICMSFHYGTAIYFIWGFGPWYHWPLVVIGAMGVNAMMVKVTNGLEEIAELIDEKF